MASPEQSIVVSGLPDFPTEETAEDKITLYFQNRAQSSGGDVREVKVNTESRQAVVTFEEPSVAQNVLAQSVHIINNTNVHVEPYSPARVDSAGLMTTAGGDFPSTAPQQRQEFTYPAHPLPVHPDQPPADSHQPPADAYQPPAGPHQPPANPHQPLAGPHQPPADPHQPPADPHQPPADPHQPPADPYQQPAGPYQPSAGPQQPPGDPHQPPADSLQPGTGPQQPPTNPQQPPANPHQPPTSPQQPPTNPQQPPTNPQQPPTDPQQPSGIPQEPPFAPHMGYYPPYPPAMQGYTDPAAHGFYMAGPGQQPYPGYNYPPYSYPPGMAMPPPQYHNYHPSHGQHPDQNSTHYAWFSHGKDKTSASVVSSSTKTSRKSATSSAVSSRSGATQGKSKVSSKRSSASSVTSRSVSSSKARSGRTASRSSSPPQSIMSETSTLVDEDFESVSMRGGPSSKHSYVSDWVSSTVGGPTAGATLENDCAILVSGFPSEPSKDLLELYFESKKSGGGEIRDVQIRGKKAFVAFKNAAVHSRFLSKQHKISGVEVTVEEVPGSVMQLDKTRLLVKGFQNSTSEELLSLYMESASGDRVTGIDYGNHPGVAIVTLNRISNFDRILAKAKTKQLEGQTLDIERVPVTDAILVTNLPDNASEDLVRLYFENERKSGGGAVSEMEMSPSQRMAVIHFKNPTTVSQVTSRSHKLNDKPLSVKPYDECLGDVFNSTEDSIDSKEPHLPSVETASPASSDEPSTMAKDLQAAKDVSSAYGELLAAAGNTADSSSVEESTKPKVETKEKGPSVTKSVTLPGNKLKLLMLSDFIASHPDVEVNIDKEKKEVQLTGEDHAVTTAKLHVYEMTQNPAEKKRKVSRGISAFLATEKGREHFEGCLQGNQLKVAFVVEEEKVVLYGLKNEEVERAERVMVQCVLESGITYDADSSEVLKSKESTSFFKDLQEKNLVSIHIGNKRVWVVGPPDVVPNVKQDISTYLSTNTIVTVNVDTSEGCMKFLQEYRKEDVSKVERQHTEQAVKVIWRQTGFSIKGTKDVTRDAKKKLEKVVTDVQKDKKKITKPGMRKFLTGDMGRALLVVAGQEHQCLIIPDDPSQGRGGAKIHCSHTTRQGKRLIVVLGDICKQTVDVIVNAANDTLKHGGGVAGAIARAGGPQIQQDCDRYVAESGPLADGEVMTTKAYRLPCKMVVHAVGPQWSRDMLPVEKKAKEFLLKQAVYKSMEAAKDHHSIAIPGISSGIYGYPMDLCAAAIVDSLQDFFQNNKSCTLTEVHLIEMDSRKADTFQDEFVKRFGKDKLTIPGQGPAGRKRGAAASTSTDNTLAGPGGMKIVLKQGDITKEQADVLVNTTGTNLSLGYGGVNSAFGRAGGQQLQQLCNNHGQAKPGDVVPTPAAGSLNCREVYHAVLYGMTEENPQWKLIHACLHNASRSGYRSIAFPALGTGGMGFRREDVARSTYDAILSFCHRNRGASVKDIRIIVFDQPTIKAFEKELKNRQEGVRAPPGPAAAMPTGGGRGTDIYSAVRRPQPGVQEMDMAGVTVEVKIGDITTEAVDAIVNPTRNDLGLGGGMAKVVSDAAGGGLQRECQQYIQRHGNLGNGCVVVTGGHNLLCSKVLHLTSPNNPQQLRGYVKKVLEEADKNNLQSVAFPALGTGGFNVGADKSAFCMLGGIADFVRDSNPTSVTDVKITIFQQQMLQDFHTEMDRRAAMAGHGKPNFFTKIGRLFGFSAPDADNPGQSSSRPPSRPTGSVTFPTSDPKELTLFLFGPDKARIDRAKKEVDKIVGKNCKDEKIQNAAITMLTPQEARMIHTYGEDRDVIVKRGNGIDCLHIQGANDDVTEVLKKIWTVLNAKVEEQRNLEKAHSVQKDAQWCYVVANGREQKIHPAANAIIETAYHAKKPSVKYDDDNEDCVIDFKTMKVTMKQSKRTYPVQRRDKRAEGGGGGLPSTWDPQPLDRSTKKPKIYHIVPLNKGSHEYNTVQGKFTNSLDPGMKATVVSIERIQNPTLWTQYCAQRQKITQINPRRKVERELWHGTKKDVTDAISQNGFNRSYSGGNVGTWEGQGSYFALKAAYSTKPYYSVPDPVTKHKKMFLCKVTTGEYTKGSADMTKAPMRTDKPNVPFDSTVNDVNNPTVFVIFHDAQAYPEYLITFTMP